MKNDFNSCPMCGSKKISWRDGKKWLCPDCGFDLYCNVAAAVGIVLYDDYGNLLFEVRAKEPRKGFLCLPGGFVDPDESAEAAVVRECREEMGARVSGAEFLCTFPNTYVYKNIEYKTCDIFFAAPLPEKYNSIEEFISYLKPEQSEVQKLNFYCVKTAEDIEKIPLAFESARKTLQKFILAGESK